MLVISFVFAGALAMLGLFGGLPTFVSNMWSGIYLLDELVYPAVYLVHAVFDNIEYIDSTATVITLQMPPPALHMPPTALNMHRPALSMPHLAPSISPPARFMPAVADALMDTPVASLDPADLLTTSAAVSAPSITPSIHEQLAASMSVNLRLFLVLFLACAILCLTVSFLSTLATKIQCKLQRTIRSSNIPSAPALEPMIPIAPTAQHIFQRNSSNNLELFGFPTASFNLPLPAAACTDTPPATAEAALPPLSVDASATIVVDPSFIKSSPAQVPRTPETSVVFIAADALEPILPTVVNAAAFSAMLTDIPSTSSSFAGDFPTTLQSTPKAKSRRSIVIDTPPSAAEESALENDSRMTVHSDPPSPSPAPARSSHLPLLATGAPVDNVGSTSISSPTLVPASALASAPASAPVPELTIPSPMLASMPAPSLTPESASARASMPEPTAQTPTSAAVPELIAMLTPAPVSTPSPAPSPAPSAVDSPLRGTKSDNTSTVSASLASLPPSLTDIPSAQSEESTTPRRRRRGPRGGIKVHTRQNRAIQRSFAAMQELPYAEDVLPEQVPLPPSSAPSTSSLADRLEADAEAAHVARPMSPHGLPESSGNKSLPSPTDTPQDLSTSIRVPSAENVPPPSPARAPKASTRARANPVPPPRDSRPAPVNSRLNATKAVGTSRYAATSRVSATQGKGLFTAAAAQAELGLASSGGGVRATANAHTPLGHGQSRAAAPLPFR